MGPQAVRRTGQARIKSPDWPYPAPSLKPIARLWAENDKTGGATFNVALPLTHMSLITLQAQEYA